MRNHKTRGNGDRSMFNNGKGDADRSPGWRDKYDDIAWPDGGKRNDGDGFVRKSDGKIVKRYGPAEPTKDAQAPHIKV